MSKDTETLASEIGAVCPPLCPVAVDELRLATMHLWKAQAACRKANLNASVRNIEALRRLTHHFKSMLE